MKRLLATLSVLAALAVSAVAAVPASAETIFESHGVSLTCVNTNKGGSLYTLTVPGHTPFTYEVANKPCVKL